MPEPSDILFRPPAHAVPGLLRDLVDADCSLAGIAAANHISVQALSAWMLLPDIRWQLEQINAVTCWRTRMVAATHLHASVAALNQLLTTYLAEPEFAPALTATPITDDVPITPSPRTSAPTPFQFQLLRIRRTDSIRRCIALAVNLTRVPSTPYLPPQPIPEPSTSIEASPPTGATGNSPPIATGATGGLPPVTSDQHSHPQTETRTHVHNTRDFQTLQVHAPTRQGAPENRPQPNSPFATPAPSPTTDPPALTPIEHLLAPVPQVAEHWP